MADRDQHAERAQPRLDFERYGPGHARAGEYVTRERVCPMPGCGREYVQYRLPEEFAERVRQLSLFADVALGEDCPGRWVPKWCPACEHKALHREPERRPRPRFNPRGRGGRR